MPSGTATRIAGFYDGISRFYETANSLLTLGLDAGWRRAAAEEALSAGPKSCLDLACGTGELALLVKKLSGGSCSVTGADLNRKMLAAARAKDPSARWVEAAADSLPFPDGEFDAVTVSFALRNLDAADRGLARTLAEMRRALSPGGRLVILETSRPPLAALNFLFRLYVRAAIGLLNLLRPSTSAQYGFLLSTILSFYGAGELAEIMSRAGFREVRFRRLFFGAVALHSGKK